MSRSSGILRLVEISSCIIPLVGASLMTCAKEGTVCSQPLGGAVALTQLVAAYTLTIDDASLRNRVGHVQILVSNCSSFHLSFAMYAWFGEIYLLIPVSNVNATDENANSLPVDFSQSPQDWGVKRVWSIAKGPAREVLFEYDISFEYYIDRIQSYAGYIGSDYVLGIGAFTFLVPSNFSPDQIEVRFNAPMSWAVAAPWAYENDHYRVGSIDELATATYGLGKFQISHKLVQETNVTIATYDGWGDFAGKQIAEFSFAAFEYTTDLFGTSPRKKYLAVYCPPGKDGKDVSGWAEWSQSQGIAVWGGWGLQEGLGWKRPFLHRAIHIWNAFPPFYMQAKTTTPDWTNWFLEGSTDYYAWDKALIHLGVLSDHRVLRDFFETYSSQYLGSRYDVPVAEAYQFVNDPERYTFLMYRKGALICFILDSLLQTITAGKTNFDGIMKSLYEKFANMQGVYTNRDIQNIAAHLSNQDLSAFFNNYVYGRTKLPLLVKDGDLTVDWSELLQTMKLSSITLVTTTAKVSSASLRRTRTSETSTLPTNARVTISEAQTSIPVPARPITGAVTIEMSMIAGFAVITAAAIGVFHMQRRRKNK